MRKTGRLPSGQEGEEFATGGCTGQASAEVGSTWNLERRLGGGLEQLRTRTRTTKVFGDARSAYAAAEEFRTKHADVIEQQQNRYSSMLERIRSDEPFRTFLAEQAGRAQATAPASQ